MKQALNAILAEIKLKLSRYIEIRLDALLVILLLEMIFVMVFL